MPHPASLPNSWALWQLWQEEQGPAAAGHMQQSWGRTVWQSWRPSLCPAPSCSQRHSRTSPGRHRQADSHHCRCQPLSCYSHHVNLAGVPQADTSLSKGPARAWLCVPVCDSSAVPPQPPVTPARALSPAPTQGAWHARRSRAGQQAPPDPQGAGWTATYPLCWGVQAGARGAYVTGFVTSPGRGFGGEPAPKGRAVLLRAVLGAKLYFRGSEQGSES